MSALTIADFDAYFRDCHGHTPFVWQRALAARMLTPGQPWPALLDLPTAAGKTAVMDVAIFALAAQATQPPASRTAARRIVFVVDRRVVVDGAYVRARRIRDRLAAESTDLLKRVNRALLSYGGEQALQTAMLRGGIWRDESWARSPLQPAVLVSTVDQVGSRLLFRGYGLSSSARPMHAGLLANDALIVLDEAHLSNPFEQTLAALARYRTWAEQPVQVPFAVVRMSATSTCRAEAFPSDPDSIYADARLKQRLEAPKGLSLAVAKDKKDSSFVTACVEQACAMTATGGTLAIVVNRVAAAREIHAELERLIRQPKRPLKAETILLIGRCRPVERDALLASYSSRLLAGRQRDGEIAQPPLMVVATQCVEAGADFDFDALVTECCPLDCLRQRLGRLNRIGVLPAARGVVVARADIAEGKADDPVYGPAASATWRWLLEDAAGQKPTPDYSAAALRRRLPADLGPLLAPAPDGPLLYPTYCDLWSQTDPEPCPSPDPAIFLHGPESGEPDVQLVWRADMTETETEAWKAIALLCPPVSGETLPLRISTVRGWLASGVFPRGDADVEGGIAQASLHESFRDRQQARHFLLWRGNGDIAVVDDPRTIRPGDTIMIPSCRGGCDRFGWSPDGTEPVADLAKPAYEAAGRAPVLRIFPGSTDLPESTRDIMLQVPRANETRDAEKEIRQAGLLPAGHDLVRHPAGWAFAPQRRWFEQADDLGSDTLPGNERDIELAEHATLVARLAKRYAEFLGLSDALAAALECAGLAHDWGKADPRFQALLHGSRIAALKSGKLLAKSVALSDAGRRAARAASGYPAGARHELVSVRLLEQYAAPSPEADLARHLVAAHHGRCRALAPPAPEDAVIRVSYTHDGRTMTASSLTGMEAADSGVTERFWRLTARFGWWGLAWLETLLRLADHRASERPDMETEA